VVHIRGGAQALPCHALLLSSCIWPGTQPDRYLDSLSMFLWKIFWHEFKTLIKTLRLVARLLVDK